jgi:hypothetical protein
LYGVKTPRHKTELAYRRSRNWLGSCARSN